MVIYWLQLHSVAFWLTFMWVEYMFTQLIYFIFISAVTFFHGCLFHYICQPVQLQFQLHSCPSGTEKGRTTSLRANPSCNPAPCHPTPSPVGGRLFQRLRYFTCLECHTLLFFWLCTWPNRSLLLKWLELPLSLICFFIDYDIFPLEKWGF